MSRPVLFQPPRGTRDFLPEEVARRRYAGSIIRNVFESYGFQEISTPIFEYFDLYALRSGEKIRDDMYVFTGKEREREEDRRGIPPEYVLRPELTAPVCRMFISGDLSKWPRPIKIYYIGQCFRYDRPAPGRYREFWQAGLELLGSQNPEADAEVITVAAGTLDSLGLKNYEIKVGNLAVLRGILEEHNIDIDLQNKFIGVIDKAVSEISKVKAGETIRDEKGEFLDELRILERLDEALYNLGLRDALKETIIKMIELKGQRKAVFNKAEEIFHSSQRAARGLKELDTILSLLEAHGVKDYTVDLSVARGLDFYTGTVFEIEVPDLGAQKQVCGGGRYDNLVKEFGGPHTPATGFAFGFDRLVEAMIKQEHPFGEVRRAEVIVLPASDDVRMKAIQIAEQLRKAEIRTELDLQRRSLKEALSYADKVGIPKAVIVGSKELMQRKVVVRDLKKRKQRKVSVRDVVKQLTK